MTTVDGKETLSKKLNKLKDADPIDDHSIDLHIVNTSTIRTNSAAGENLALPTSTSIDLINNHQLQKLNPNIYIDQHKNSIIEGEEIINLPQLLKDVNTQQLMLDAANGCSSNNDSKSIQVAFNNMLEPLIEPTTSRTSTTKIDNRLVINKTQINNTDDVDTSSGDVDCTSLISSTFEPLKLPSYQFPSSLYTHQLPMAPQAPPPHTQPIPPVTSYLLTDLNFPQSSLSMNSNQTFMMMDYYQRADSTFSFASDGSLVVQQNTFDHNFPLSQQSLLQHTMQLQQQQQQQQQQTLLQQLQQNQTSATSSSPTNHYSNVASYMYRVTSDVANDDGITAGSTLVSDHLHQQQQHENTSSLTTVDSKNELSSSQLHMVSSNHTIPTPSPTTIFSTGSVVGDVCDDYGDGMLDSEQVLDTNKFLNEQYFMKKTVDTNGGCEGGLEKNDTLSPLISGVTDNVSYS